MIVTMHQARSCVESSCGLPWPAVPFTASLSLSPSSARARLLPAAGSKDVVAKAIGLVGKRYPLLASGAGSFDSGGNVSKDAA
jgi:hypothetical protein